MALHAIDWSVNCYDIIVIATCVTLFQHMLYYVRAPMIAAPIVILYSALNATHPALKSRFPFSWWACGGNGPVFAPVIFWNCRLTSAVRALKSVWGDFPMHLCSSNAFLWQPIHLLLAAACYCERPRACGGLSQHESGTHPRQVTIWSWLLTFRPKGTDHFSLPLSVYIHVENNVILQ